MTGAGAAALGRRSSRGRRSNRRGSTRDGTTIGTSVGIVGAAGKTAAALVDGQGTATTTVLGAVTSTGGEAVAENAGLRCAIRRKRVATVALGCILKTCVAVSLARTEGNAGFDSHGIAAGRSGGEGAAANVVGTTANVLPLKRRSDILEVLLVGTDGSDLAVGVGTGLNRSLAGTLLDGVAARKSLKQASNLLVNLRRNDTSLTLLGSEQIIGDDRAVRQETAVVGALLDSALKSRNVPTVDEVTVEPVASRVTHSKDERLAAAIPLVAEVTGVVVNLKEDGDQVDRVAAGAAAAVVATANGVRHVRLVVSGIKVDTIPARREEDLGTETIGAVLGRKTIASAGAASVVEADETNGLRCEVVSVVALEGVTSDHAEALGEGLELVVVGTTTLEIVDSHTAINTSTIAGLVDTLERSVLVLEVEERRPIVRKIRLDGARRAVRRTSIGVVHVKLKAITTGNGVSVAGDLSRGDDGVGTLGDNTTRAGHTEESSSRCGEGGSQAENLGGSIHLESRYWDWSRRRKLRISNPERGKVEGVNERKC